MRFETEIFSQFKTKWALLTAGDEKSFNTMTISWGGLGTIWGKPVATVYVRTSRYTHEFMDSNDYFTISFYPEDKHEILVVMGAKSGRDIDKMHFKGLTPIKAEASVTFKEAERTIVCRKLFKQRVEVGNIPKDIVEQYYSKDAPHDMYIGEVIAIL